MADNTRPVGDRYIGDRRVTPIGLGGMPLSLKGPEVAAEASRTIHAALGAGITLIDTADVYVPDDATELGHNELLIAEALRTWSGDSDQILVATKAGMGRRGPQWFVQGRPDWIHRAVEDSLARLGVATIGLYQFHAPDDTVPFADSIGAFRELHDQGKVQRVGVSNVSTDQIREARGILGDSLVSVQNRFNIDDRSSAAEIDLCTEFNLAFLAYSPVGGMRGHGELGDRGDLVKGLSEKYAVSPYQIVLAWELAYADCVIPIPGASRPASILDSVGALRVDLDPDDVAALTELA